MGVNCANSVKHTEGPQTATAVRSIEEHAVFSLHPPGPPRRAHPKHRPTLQAMGTHTHTRHFAQALLQERISYPANHQRAHDRSITGSGKIEMIGTPSPGRVHPRPRHGGVPRLGIPVTPRSLRHRVIDITRRWHTSGSHIRQKSRQRTGPCQPGALHGCRGLGRQVVGAHSKGIAFPREDDAMGGSGHHVDDTIKAPGPGNGRLSWS